MAKKKAVAGDGKERNEIIPIDTFIRHWQVSGTMDEFIKATGMNRSSAAARAVLLRNKGVQLKKYPRAGRSSHDYKALNQLAKESLK